MKYYDELEQRQKLLFGLVSIILAFNKNVIETQGIVIVDESGKERILIGAPIHRS